MNTSSISVLLMSAGAVCLLGCYVQKLQLETAGAMCWAIWMSSPFCSPLFVTSLPPYTLCRSPLPGVNLN